MTNIDPYMGCDEFEKIFRRVMCELGYSAPNLGEAELDHLMQCYQCWLNQGMRLWLRDFIKHQILPSAETDGLLIFSS